MRKVLALTLLLLAACSSTGTLRLCNGHLEPINPPAPARSTAP